MAETGRVKCVFVDIVGFTNNRSVEAQSDLVAALNGVVTEAISGLAIPESDLVLIPTGDGMAIAMINLDGFDLHLQLALEVLRLVAERNRSETDAMRRFEVRIGVNQNEDNIVTDVNGKRNVAGAGISMAQRIMDKADGGQVLVGVAVYDVLRQRESYLSSFARYRARGKHDVEFDVYQYVAKDAAGLNIATPTSFARSGSERPKLTNLVAHYMCHAINQRDFLVAQKDDPIRDYAAVMLLGFLAEDSLEAANTPAHDEPLAHTWGAGTASFGEQYGHYREFDTWPLIAYSSMFCEKHLERHAECFERDSYSANYAFVSASGIEKLWCEHPALARAYEIPPVASQAIEG